MLRNLLQKQLDSGGSAAARLSLAKTNICLQEQRKQSFLTLELENQSRLVSKSSDIFL